MVAGEATPGVVRDARCAPEPSTTRGAVGASAPAKFRVEVSPTERPSCWPSPRRFVGSSNARCPGHVLERIESWRASRPYCRQRCCLALLSADR